jgi:hypothetical protein
MGVQVLDWNGDGRPDLYVTDMHTDMSSDLKPEEDARKHDPKTFFPADFLGTDGHHVLGNALFTSTGPLTFVEESDKAGVETGWPWGPSVGDLNADGWPDIYVAAGMNYPFRYRGSDILLNDGGRRFAPAEYILGVEPRRGWWCPGWSWTATPTSSRTSARGSRSPSWPRIRGRPGSAARPARGTATSRCGRPAPADRPSSSISMTTEISTS